jgi:hypothetical protein
LVNIDVDDELKELEELVQLEKPIHALIILPNMSVNKQEKKKRKKRKKMKKRN